MIESRFNFLRLSASIFMLPALLMSSGADDFCDPTLQERVAARNPYRYQNRGDRCEGIFIRDVSGGGGLLVASLTSTLSGLGPQTSGAALVRWERFAQAADLQIRVYSMRQRLPYRLDTRRPATSGEWLWPLDILALHQLWPPDVGVVAWTVRSIAGKPDLVYIPVAVGSKSPDPARVSYRLVIVPPSALADVTVSVTHASADGRPDRVVQNPKSLDYGDYPAGVGIPVPLPFLPVSGLYRVEIAGSIRSGGDNSVSLWLERPIK